MSETIKKIPNRIRQKIYFDDDAGPYSHDLHHIVEKRKVFLDNYVNNPDNLIALPTHVHRKNTELDKTEDWETISRRSIGLIILAFIRRHPERLKKLGTVIG